MRQRISRKKLRRRRRFIRRLARMGVLCTMIIFMVLIVVTVVNLFCKIKNYDNGQSDVELAGKGLMESTEQPSDIEVVDLVQQLKEQDYPESLLELMEKHPETSEFVLGYKENKDKIVNPDLSHEVSEGEIPLFLQWDERWGYQFYGDDFMAVTGCGPACLAMVRCGLSGDTYWDPLKVARMADEQGYYVDGAGSSWELMTSGAEQIGLTAYEISFDENSILAELWAGNPIICVLGPGDFTTTGHFIVLVAADEYGDVTIRDPNSRRNSERTWRLEELMPQIRNLWGYILM